MADSKPGVVEQAERVIAGILFDGAWLRGQFIDITASRPYNDRAGVEHIPGRLSVLVGSQAIGIEFGTVAEAQASVPAGVVKLDTVLIPVFVQGGWDNESRRRGPVFYRGRRNGSDSGPG